ncbi:MAG: hypothetical protein EPO28_08800 [Saprospiraceae bacterium]|nr:MAG: hypothetical protein EPO28_08800 [Saprospiraceae bacterium]
MSSLAHHLIAENKKSKATRLDLGNCGLTELPPELFELEWLEELVLSNEWWDWEKNDKQKSQNKGAANRLVALPSPFSLAHLKKLVIAGIWENKWEITDLTPLEKLTGLTQLDFRYNKVSDLTPLEKLTGLVQLDIKGNKVSDLTPLEKLTGLTQLDIRSNQVSDLTPLEKLTGLAKLHFSSNQVSDLTPLEKLTGLTQLDFWSNKVSDLTPLGKLTGLTQLDFRYNQASDLTPLKKLTGLTQLDFRYNQVSDLKPLEKLTGLTQLDFWGNQVSDLKPIEKLTKLTLLGFSENQVSDLKPLEKLTALTQLYFGSNHVSDLKPLEKLTALTQLNLSVNQVSDLKPLEKLTALTQLDFRGNNVSDLTPVEKMTGLTQLYFRSNQVSDLTPLGKLTGLTQLDFRSNQVNDLTPLLPLIKKGFTVEWGYFKDNPWQTPPPEIIQQGNPAILGYFAALGAQSTGYIYEAKLLLLGEGGAGKTSLCRKLQDPNAALPDEKDTTKGIEIHCLHFPMKNGSGQSGHGKQFRMNVWDFGGQAVYHATHQFFLNKRSLYVLLDDTRKDDRTVNDPAFRYWLQVVGLLGGGSPLLIVQNEKGDRSKDLDLQGMKASFGFIKDSYPVNLLDGRGLETLRQAIEFHIQNLPHVGSPLPRQWVAIRQEVERLAGKRECIGDTEWFDLCARNGIGDRRQAKQLSGYLHDIGVFLHFQEDDLLRRTVILQKDWATTAVYRVLDDEPVKANGGKFDRSDLARIWQEERFDERRGELLALMVKFELCYAVPDAAQEQWLAPQLLPAAQPAYEWSSENNLTLRYRYGFLPKGLLNRLLVRLHRFLPRTDLAWRSGAVLERLGARAEVMELPLEAGVVSIRAQGQDQALRKELLTLIAGEFDKLNDSFHQLPVEKLFPCVCDECRRLPEPNFYEYSDLLKRKQKGQRTVECKISYEYLEVATILGEVVASMGEQGEIETKQPPIHPSEKEKGKGKKELIKTLIGDNEIAKAFGKLQAALPGNRLLTLLQAQWNQLRQDEIQGVLSFENTTTRRNQIIGALLALTDEVAE